MRSVRAIACGVSMLALASAEIALAQADVAAVESDEIVVTGVRAALNEASAIERASDTVVSVITADDAGQFADQNVAESLQRIPGVTIQRVEGEGRTIQVRGLSSNFNQVVVNGAQIGSSDPDGNRSVSLDLISSDLLSGIRVAKTLTPDTDHDSLGAQVNLLTLSAFDRKGTTARIRGEAGLAEYSDRASPRVSGDFTTRLAGDTIGIAVAATYSKRFIQSEEIRGGRPLERFVSATGTVSNATSVGATRFLVPNIVDQRLKNNERERIGSTVQFDYRPDDDNKWSLTLLGARLKDSDVRRQNEWEIGQAGTITALQTGKVQFNNTRVEQQLFFQNSTDRLLAANFLGENKFGDLTIGYGADASKNKFKLPNGLRTRFASPNTVVIGVDFDRDRADVTVLNPAATPFNPAANAFNQLLIIDESRTDNIYSGFADLKYDFQLGDNAASIKAGVKYRDRTKVIRRGELSLNPTNGTNRPRTTAAGLATSLAQLTIARPSNVSIPGYFQFPDPETVRRLAQDAATLFALAPTGVRRDFDFEERTWAGYLQGQIDFSSAVTLIGGVRAERTRYTAAGATLERIELNGSAQPEILSAPRSFTRESTEYFPSLHLRADLAPTLVGRLSVSRSQVRPTFDDAKNFQEIDTVRTGPAASPVTIRRELEGGNPQLRPLIADQIDATLGWYPGKRTALTGAAFYKKLKNPFISASFAGPQVAIVGLPVFDPATGLGFTQADVVDNGGSGKLYGVELGLNQQFGGAFEGFFANGNLTLIKGEARSPFVRNNAKLRLEDQAEVVANLSFGYEDERVTLRASGTYVGDRLESVDSANAEFDVVRASFYTVDLNARFNMTRWLQVYADIANLTNQNDYRYTRGIDGAGLVNRTSNYGRTFQLGAIVNF